MIDVGRNIIITVILANLKADEARIIRINNAFVEPFNGGFGWIQIESVLAQWINLIQQKQNHQLNWAQQINGGRKT